MGLGELDHVYWKSLAIGASISVYLWWGQFQVKVLVVMWCLASEKIELVEGIDFGYKDFSPLLSLLNSHLALG